MEGAILYYDNKSATGIIEGQDGKLFPFKGAEWQPGLRPRRRDRVEFDSDGGQGRNVRFPKGQAPAGATLRKVSDGFDLGYIAGLYAILFLLAATALAVLNIVLSIVALEEAELIVLAGAFVLLDILAPMSWMLGSHYRKMRAFASIVAAVGTVALVAIMVRQALLGGA
jgi:hypothetical protein